jgi:tRNA (cmo5U34)-methyltransferase
MSFDRIAPVYDRLARLVFGRSLERAQTVFLDRIPARARVLIVGGGTGFLLNALLTKRLTRKHTTPPTIGPVLYLEASGTMLRRAARRMLRGLLVGTVVFRLGDESALEPNERFDVVLLPFVLDLYTDDHLRRVSLPRLLAVTAPDGQWLVTDFVQPPGSANRLLLSVMLLFFRVVARISTRRLADWPGCLADAGLVLLDQHDDRAGFVRSARWGKPAEANL